MFRRLQSNFGKTKEATYTAGEDMKKGMLVVKDRTNGEALLPSAISATGVFIVDVDPEYVDMLAVKNNISDYDDLLNDISDGDPVTLELLEVGEVYGTDQFDTASYTIGDYLAVGVDGKLEAYAGVSTPLVVVDPAYDDAGNTLLVFEVTDTPVVAS